MNAQCWGVGPNTVTPRFRLKGAFAYPKPGGEVNIGRALGRVSLWGDACKECFGGEI
jgi:hypothetical protein